MTASFGAPAPLPGQPGFRERPSVAMARETEEMEARLSRLKTDLAAEADQRVDAGPQIGNDRWRSARADRGSVRAYAKDIKARHQQRLQRRQSHGAFASGLSAADQTKPQAGAGAWAAAALRDEQNQRLQWQAQTRRDYDPSRLDSEQRPSAHAHDSGNKKASNWSIEESLEWLQGLGLRQYRGVFRQNEIAGPVLLEVGPHDLDYMNIRILAHRKRLLKGIDDLRRAEAQEDAEACLPPTPSRAHKTKSVATYVTDSGVDVALPTGDGQPRRQGDRQSPRQERGRHHWSHVTPLSDNQAEDPAVDRPARLADGCYDEAAARSSFVDAVEEWRRLRRQPRAHSKSPQPLQSGGGRAPVAEFSEGGREGSIMAARSGKGIGLLACSARDECWANPFTSPRASVKADAKNSYGGEDPELKLFSQPCVGSTDTESESIVVAKTDCGVSVLSATSNDDDIRSLMASRDRPKNGGVRNSGSGVGVSIDPAEGITPRLTTVAVAEALRDQMDAEHRAQAAELERRKKKLLDGLQAARLQGASARSVGDQGDMLDRCASRTSSSSTSADRVLSSSGGSHNAFNNARAESDLDSWGTLSHENRSDASSVASSRSEGPRSVEMQQVHGRVVDIELTDSIMGIDNSGPRGGVAYVVDEGSSSDNTTS